MTVVVDTSALMAVVLGEPDAEDIAAVMSEHAGDLIVSAATLVEARIVVEAKAGSDRQADLSTVLETLAVRIEPVDEAQAVAAVTAWQRFGKGRHPAGLNFGDCFSYALARTHGAALLFKGGDFSQTDVRSAR